MMDKHIITLLEGMIEGCIVVDHQGKSVYLNHAAKAILQKKQEEVLGKNIHEIFPEIVGSIFWEKYCEAIKIQTPVDFEAYFKPMQKWFHMRYQPCREGVRIYFEDVTAHRLLQQQVDETLAIVAESSPIGFAFFDKELRFRRINRMLAGGTNSIPYLEHIGKTMVDVFPAIASQVTHALQEVIATGKTVTYEVSGNPPNAPEMTRHWLAKVYPVNTPSGDLLGIGDFIMDITDLRQAEETKRESEARLRRLLESNVIGIAVCNDVCIFDANDALLTMLGYTRQEMLEGKLTYTAISPPEYASQDRQRWKELIERGTCHSIEKEYLRKDGSRVPVMIGSARLQMRPPMWINFILDLSERKELERRKDTFIRLASHELRTPLTTIKGLTQLLKRRLEREERRDYVNYLTTMEEQIKRMTGLITEFLDVPRMEESTLTFTDEPMEIDTLIQECISMVQQTTTTHRLILHGASGKSLRGDREHLKRAFTNLLNNAVKYSPRGRVVNVTLAASDDAMSVSIQDYGMGIPQALQGKIFERFYRVSRASDLSRPGTGLGLYVANQIVQHHGGRIAVESVEGEGSTFTVCLPLHAMES